MVLCFEVASWKVVGAESYMVLASLLDSGLSGAFDRIGGRWCGETSTREF